ncbi:hypothetical protein C8T65DRAFT_638332 [Cerioporus squamosus]|nr:hypothetical protein C8T65DRAFT_638332 [Cerioporus squamosus]
MSVVLVFGAVNNIRSSTIATCTRTRNELLADYFEKSAFAVRNIFARFERKVARPLIQYLLVSFRERPVASTFVATYVVLSALPVLSFIGFSVFVFTAFAFLALALAIVCASSVVGFVGFWLACILFLFLFVAGPSPSVPLRHGPRTALSELAELARRRQLGADNQGTSTSSSDAVDVKKEDPDSEVDSVVVVRPGEAQKETQILEPTPGVPVDAPA